jgi:putative Holliday junction resolvase
VRQAFDDPQAQSGTVLAFDFGTKRVGVAVGDLARGIAHPLSTIAFEDNRRRLDAIAALVAEWQPVRLIVGAPGGARQDDHTLHAHIGRFIRRLSARFGIEVDVIDETLSSWAASRKLSQGGLRAESQKHLVDAMAACVILETWFEDRRPGATLPKNER